MEEIEGHMFNHPDLQQIYSIILELKQEIGELQKQSEVITKELEYLKDALHKHEATLLEIKTVKKVRSQMAQWVYRFAVPVIGGLLAIGAILHEMQKLVK